MTTRPDGIAYIDTVQPPPEAAVEILHAPASESGSSVEEDSDHGDVQWDEPEPPSDAEGSGSSAHGEEAEDSIEEEDNVDDADWELSTRGTCSVRPLRRC